MPVIELAEDDDAHVLGEWLVLEILEIAQHDGEVVRAAIALVVVRVHRRQIDAEVAQRARFEQRIDLLRREAGGVAELRYGKVGGEQRADEVDEAAVDGRLVVALQENAVERGAEGHQLVDDALEERHRYLLVRPRRDGDRAEVALLVAGGERLQRDDLEQVAAREVFAVAQDPTIGQQRRAVAAPIENAAKLRERGV